MTGVLSYL